ncbi:unannotated protein [freshwater metagenome]|uniref:Unannotated protein n=1 Tax=freshwater metagenome TaxID=449393 RepID=A0A6J6B2Y3_9ZZZZ
MATASAAFVESIGDTRIESVRRSKRAPSEVSAAIINSLSRETSGSISSVAESASAAKTSSRLVSDFEPGSLMLAAIGALTVGATQGSEYFSEVIGYKNTSKSGIQWGMRDGVT